MKKSNILHISISILCVYYIYLLRYANFFRKLKYNKRNISTPSMNVKGKCMRSWIFSQLMHKQIHNKREQSELMQKCISSSADAEPLI